MRLARTHQVLLAIGAVIALLGILGFRFNLTRSLPPGVYRVTPEAAVRGAIVNVCLPREVAEFAKARGYLGPGSCDGGVRPLRKAVLALEGDVVTLRLEGIRVNGAAVPRSATVPRDSRGRPLPHYPCGEYRLEAGELWLFSPYRPNAYDSRYFGPVKLERVVSVLKPVWTWGFRVPGLGERSQLASTPRETALQGGQHARH
jgi:conjugative transfer signal peptidase TraF